MLDPKEQAKQGFGAHVAREKERHDAGRTTPSAETITSSTEDSRTDAGEIAIDPADAERAARPSTPPDGSR